MDPDSAIWGGAYQIVRTCAATALLDRCSLTAKGINVVKGVMQERADAAIEGTVALALSLVDGIVSGHFAARVPLGTTCLSYCDHRDVCREADVAEKTW